MNTLFFDEFTGKIHNILSLAIGARVSKLYILFPVQFSLKLATKNLLLNRKHISFYSTFRRLTFDFKDASTYHCSKAL